MNARKLLIAVVLLMFAHAASAQSTFGSIVGTAQDQSALAVPGATITLRSVDENTTQALVSAADGTFQFLNLKPGAYEPRASRAGGGHSRHRDRARGVAELILRGPSPIKSPTRLATI